MTVAASPKLRDSITAALSLLLLGAQSVLPPGTALKWRLLPGLLAIVLVVLRQKKPSPTLGLSLMIAVLTLSMGLGVLWQVAMPLSLVALHFTAKQQPALQLLQIERGSVPLFGTLFCGLVTPFALGAWVYLFKPDLSDLTDIIPDVSVALLILGAVVFAFFNALFEELVWREVIQPRLTSLWGVPWALFLQAVSFGVAHTWGFPRGATGVLLAGSWALMLGILRHKSGGLLAVLLAHIVADATIAAIVLFWL